MRTRAGGELGSPWPLAGPDTGWEGNPETRGKLDLRAAEGRGERKLHPTGTRSSCVTAIVVCHSVLESTMRPFLASLRSTFSNLVPFMSECLLIPLPPLC